MKEKPSEIGFPQTIADAEARGYRFLNAAKCGGCGVTIDWYQTPNGRRMPVDTGDGTAFVAHFSTCPERDRFRRKR